MFSIENALSLVLGAAVLVRQPRPLGWYKKFYVIYTYLWSIFAYYPNLGYRKRIFA
jgi:hypothetical protein